MHSGVHLFLYLLRFPFVIAISLSHWISLLWSDENRIYLSSLYVLFSHFSPRDGTPENCFFQMQSYARASMCMCMHNFKMKRQKANSLENISWSELGKQKHTSLISTDNFFLFQLWTNLYKHVIWTDYAYKKMLRVQQFATIKNFSCAINKEFLLLFLWKVIW